MTRYLSMSKKNTREKSPTNPTIGAGPRVLSNCDGAIVFNIVFNNELLYFSIDADDGVDKYSVVIVFVVVVVIVVVLVFDDDDDERFIRIFLQRMT